MQRFWAVLILAAMATTVSTQPTQCLPTMNSTANLPPGYSVYRTDRPVTPYELAERFYGHGWESYRIVEVNRLKLLPSGAFPPGIDIVLPPDLSGRAVRESLLKKDKQY
jgi:hypothetical protein